MSKFGIKEVADVIFFDIATGKPVIFFDTLKVSTIENSSDSVSATGGRGNANLVTWNFGRTATLQMQDALLSIESLALLSGNEVTTGGKLYKRERIVATDTTASLAEVPLNNKVDVYELTKGAMATTPTASVTATSKQITGLTKGKTYAVFYEYQATENAKTVKFTTDKFPGTYRVVGDTIVRDQITGKDRVAQFYIPKAQLQSGFSLTMDAENVSTFDFNLDMMRDGETTDFYYITVL